MTVSAALTDHILMSLADISRSPFPLSHSLCLRFISLSPHIEHRATDNLQLVRTSLN